jgi:hypothetical protein
MIAIDTETYFHKTTCSVRHLGAEAYTRHPLFYCYMVSIWGEGIKYVGPPEDAPWDKIAGKLWVAHNAQFDMWVIKRMRDSGQIPDVAPSGWRDTSAIPAYMQIGRSLGNASKFLLGETPDKAIRDGMSGKHYKDLPQDEKQLMLDYALEDARLCHDLYDKFADQLPEHEWKLAELTVEQGIHGVQINRQLLEEQLGKVQVWELQFLQDIPWRDEKAPLSVAALRTQCREDRIPDMPKTTQADNPEWVEWFGKYKDQFPYIKAFTELRRLRKHLATLETLVARVDPDDIYHFGLKYCGSRLTGRWSGDGGLNMQNLPKGELFGASIRHLFTARPGHKLLVADLSQIEPRCIAYTAGDWKFLDHVRNGIDCYEAHARSTMGYKDPRPLKEVDNGMRQLAKARALGLGYGCGAARFKDFASLFGIDYTEAEAQDAVTQYRTDNPKLVRYWYEVENDMKKHRDEEHNTEATAPWHVELFSGRKLFWFDIKQEEWQTQDGKSRSGYRATTEKGNRIREAIWGSKLTENIIQALARDVFAVGVLRVWDAGIRVLWTVHDEMVCEVPEDQVEEAMATVRKAMTTPVDWIPELPLDVDIHAADYYDK